MQLKRSDHTPDEAPTDEGFTLVELVMTVAILGIVTVGLVGVVLSYFSTTVDTQARLTESQSVQFAAAYWQRDVASIGVRSYDSGTKTFPLQRSVGVTPACSLPSGMLVTTLAWSEYDEDDLDSTATPATVTVSYLTRPADGARELIRVRCTDATSDSVVVVARSLNAEPTVTCDVACGGSGNAVPTFIDLHLSAFEQGRTDDAAYTATLSGERRQS
ncbi:prepilin-type N-terminal cleavage/methylation domain-containing protein [Nocardioides dubius]|uniref:Prepilin-type N-terminal cleavage/methylation domain-containing protein n=1 Tax=Nocardioides dubius TaxID=317019 RepID=A0ABP4EGU6_9ACTN